MLLIWVRNRVSHIDHIKRCFYNNFPSTYIPTIRAYVSPHSSLSFHYIVRPSDYFVDDDDDDDDEGSNVVVAEVYTYRLAQVGL